MPSRVLCFELQCLDYITMNVGNWDTFTAFVFKYSKQEIKPVRREERQRRGNILYLLDCLA